ncbi:NAD(P)H-hydrate epimerase, partial [Synechococcus sp. MU1643]|uniref:NAD(P)H-hydrate epimerase n=1 Tax=Synechococcus sp. MU1643 TaxID=2508349 RepID=UPI00272D6387
MEKVRLGQSRPLPESLADLFRRRQQQQPGALISLDVPSGLCCDHGNVLGYQAACAAVTLSVGWLKRGLYLDPALPWVSSLVRLIWRCGGGGGRARGGGWVQAV